MSEDKIQATTETVSESLATENTQDSSNDYLIAESKKYRKRAQDAETRLAKLEKSNARAEKARLESKEEYKTLYENEASEHEIAKAKAANWDNYEETTRVSLIEKHPEEERARLSKLHLDDLIYITNKINDTKPNAPQLMGSSKNDIPDKPWSEMDDTERRAYYTHKANQGNR